MKKAGRSADVGDVDIKGELPMCRMECTNMNTTYYYRTQVIT